MTPNTIQPGHNSLLQGELGHGPDSIGTPRMVAGLIAVKDPAYEKPVFRRETGSGIRTFEEIDQALGAILKEKREAAGLSRDAIAELIGLSTQVYGRYERGFSALTATRLIHVCEVLNMELEEMIFAVAPHLYGASQDEAETRYAALSMLRRLDAETLEIVSRLLKQIQPDHLASSSSESGQ